MTTNNIYSPRTARLLYGLLIFVAAFTSCKKTEYEQTKRPYNTMAYFTIGGYADLDSINAVITDNEITLYWSADSVLPKKIKPRILVSEGATVSPASGEEVSFSESTVYTVTAEDGTERQYTLKPVQHEAIPVLAGFADESHWGGLGPDWQYGKGKKLKINGQYFLHYNDASGIRVYAQRMRDGFEFDLEVDPAETSTTQVAVDLPKLTAELDTGMHRIYVQVGDYPSNSLEVWVAPPSLIDVAKITLREAGQTIYIGDKMHFDVEIDETKMEPELFEKYYNNENYWYYSGQGSFFEQFQERYYGFTTNDTNNSPQESRATIDGKVFTIPVTEDKFGQYVGVQEYDSPPVYLKGEQFLNSIMFYFHLRKYQDETYFRNDDQIKVLSSTDEATQKKTIFKRREK